MSDKHNAGDATQLRSFDEGDVATAQMAISGWAPGPRRFDLRGLAHSSVLALRRRLGGLKRLLGRVRRIIQILIMTRLPATATSTHGKP